MSINPCCVAEERKDIDGDDRWMSIHNRFLLEAREKEFEVLFLGDDILLELNHTEIYKDFEELHPMNFSIRGDKIENLLWRITIGRELDNVKPKIMVVQIGTNNTSTNNTEEEISEGVLEVLKEIRKRHDCFIVLLTLLPRGHKPNKLREKNEKVNNLLMEKVRGMSKVQIIDISKGLINADDSTISHHDMYDYLNPSNAAYKKIFEPVLDLLNQILNENEKELLTPSE
ncbi:hypothetical protein PVAND_014163 [Polypedilum vanderplanki]|uniref:SGNH hydrolase-type esterase domain-containing protein n=1 Tax=Polypedilum vanderplanki TaxID=319348 RepID=A0A9J6CSB9_POLVA|nr:hypothetical protein PVAND_014163 [Polypedilum vanderplanki]